jgi:hypothetical protein
LQKAKLTAAAIAAQIRLSFRRLDGGTTELPVLEGRCRIFRWRAASSDRIVTNLMSKTARAGVNDQRDLVEKQTNFAAA